MARLCEKCGKLKLYQSYPISSFENFAGWVFFRPFVCGFCNLRVMRFSVKADSKLERRSKRQNTISSSLSFEASAAKTISIEEVRGAIRRSEERLRQGSE